MTRLWLLAPLLALGASAAPGESEHSRESARATTSTRHDDDRGAVDRFDEVHATFLEDGHTVVRSDYPLRPRNFRWNLIGCTKSRPEECTNLPPTESPHSEAAIHPLLTDWLTQRPRGERARLVVSLSSRIRIPRFPEPAIDQPWGSPANRQARHHAKQLIQSLQKQRRKAYGAFEVELRTSCPDARIRDRAWLTNSLLIDAPLTCVEAIARFPRVLYIEPDETDNVAPRAGERVANRVAPSCGGNCVATARRLIASDQYFDLGLDGGTIGVLDTGMLFSQVLLKNPKRVRRKRNCVLGKLEDHPFCRRHGAEDPCNHGTKTGTIISANDNLTDSFRGVTAIQLDSFRVFRFDGRACRLNTWAAIRGFHAAVAALNQVIVAEITAAPDSDISRVANAAFDTGAVVVAANGNSGNGECTVQSPAIATKVLGVGAVNVSTHCLEPTQSRGPAPIGRIKPDIQAPTRTRTGDATSNVSVGIYNETSGATPYAAGAAALIRDWLWHESATLDPGQTYAQMILSGQPVDGVNNTSGAGPIELPTDGWVWWGKTSVTRGESIEIPLRVDVDGLDTFDGALWWPQKTPRKHNDLDLLLIDPEHEVRAQSCLPASIFERARVSGEIQTGTWKLRIEGASFSTRRQTVYWSARAWRDDKKHDECTAESTVAH